MIIWLTGWNYSIKMPKAVLPTTDITQIFFHVRRGVRQGCPLSPYLFIICIELLSNEVIKNQNINGININGKEFKTSMFADDASFIMDGSRKSFDTLIYIMDNFTNIYGFKLNAKKCQVLRIGPLKSKPIEFMKHRKFSWNSNEASCLGMVKKKKKKYYPLIWTKSKRMWKVLTAMESQKTYSYGQNCCNKKLRTSQTYIFTDISAKPNKGND